MKPVQTLLNACERLLKDLQDQLPSPGETSPGVFFVQSFLFDIRSPDILYSENCQNILSRLSKKIEVVHILRKAYAEDLMKAVDTGPVQEEYLRFVGFLYFHSAIRFRNYKFLNTVFKMKDGILGQQGFTLDEKAEDLLQQFMEQWSV